MMLIVAIILVRNVAAETFTAFLDLAHAMPEAVGIG